MFFCVILSLFGPCLDSVGSRMRQRVGSGVSGFLMVGFVRRAMIVVVEVLAVAAVAIVPFHLYSG